MAPLEYSSTAAAYAVGVRGLFAPSSSSTRGQAIAPDAEELARRAEQLQALAAALNQETIAYLGADDADVRLGAEQHLLAQAAANLQVADGLLAAAATAGEIEAPPPTRGPQPAPLAFDPLLAILQTPLAETGASVRPAGQPTRGTPSASRDELLATAGEVFEDVLGSTGRFARDVLAGIVGLDPALLKQAAGMVSKELGELVQHLGDQASRLLAKAVAFIVQAYDNLLAALGQDATSQMRRQVAEWLDRLQEGEALSTLLGHLFEVSKAQQRVQAAVAGSDASAVVLGQTQQAVAALPAGFAARTKLCSQLLAALGLLKHIAATRLPMVEAATAALYVALLGFVVFVGGDYVDAPRLERINRIPGVVHVVETGLAGR